MKLLCHETIVPGKHCVTKSLFHCCVMKLLCYEIVVSLLRYEIDVSLNFCVMNLLRHDVTYLHFDLS